GGDHARSTRHRPRGRCRRGDRSRGAHRHGARARQVQDFHAAGPRGGQGPRDRRTARRHARDRAQGGRARALHREPVRPDPRARAGDGTIPMTRLVVLLLLASTSAFAQYRGPAVESCRAYAIKDLKREGNQPSDVVFEQDRLLIERYTRKVGNQFVSSVLSGDGAVVYDGVPSAELSFICLLADEKRPVFFAWLPRQNSSALAQCTRHDTTRAQPRR